MPQSAILVGEHVDGGDARFVALHLAKQRSGEPAGAFFERAVERARETVAPLEDLRMGYATAEDFIEPGGAEAFLMDVKPASAQLAAFSSISWMSVAPNLG